MHSYRPDLSVALCLTAGLLFGACQESSHSPPGRREPPVQENEAAGSMLEPVDLVYICGNKFLATNATRSAVHVTYRVAGTDESGGLTLRGGLHEDQGFSETELETNGRGAVELFRDGERVARRGNENRSCGASPVSASVAGVAGSGAGSWTAPFVWPNVAVHLSLLPDGRVLSWGSSEGPYIWDPATGAFTRVPSPTNVFCGGHAFLPDGRLLVSGGHITEDHGLPDNTIFDPATERWSTSTPMLRGRWYPTSTTLGSGDVVIIAGRDQAAERVLEPEVWTPGGVRILSGASRAFPYYPRAFLAPNGKVFYAGEQRPSRYLDVSGTGDWETGFTSVLYGNREYGAAVMYDEGKVLYVGGGRTTNTAETIDLNSAAPAWQWTGSMAYPRRHLNATVLPTGEVLATSGTSGPGFNDIATVVHAAEVWSPVTGTWTTLASNSVDRGYHSTSVLLPDGRVLHAGSGQGGGQDGIMNAELFSPPYLFAGTRPTITGAPSRVGYGTSFRVLTPESDITQVSLVRLGSTTHAFDMNQRFQWLSFAREAGALKVTAPTSRNVAPPGHYMLFVLNEAGAPSAARIVQMGSSGDPPLPPPDAAPTASFTVNCAGLGCEFTDSSTDDGEVTAWSWDFDDNSGSSLERHPRYAYAVEGSYDVTLTVTDDNFATGTVTQPVTVTPPPPNSPPTAGFTINCTGLTCTFTEQSSDSDGSVTAWSWTFGDGTSATTRNPSRTYPATGTYTVTLVATDNGGATGTSARALTVSGPTFVLSVTSRSDATTQYMVLTWGGASGAMVDVYRNGGLLKTTENDGKYTNTRTFVGAATYTYKLCQAGTTVCSNDASVVFGGGGTQNKPPVANFSSSCNGRDCGFTDMSTDSDGSVTAWSWAFGDGTTSTLRNPSHAYAAAGSYEASLLATDDDGATATSKKTVVVAPAGLNSPPTAGFTSSCTGLTCTFTDQSSDSDGSVAAWSWSFGDGTSATTRNPSRTYPATGTYTVTLVATDNGGATGTNAKALTVSGPTFVLSVTSRSDATTQYMVLTWGGASGAMVNVYRNGALLKTTENDGKYTNTRTFVGAATYAYKLCQAGSAVCSNGATVVFP